MKIRSALITASALISVALLSACAGSDGETSGGAGSSSAGAPANLGGGGSTAVGGDTSGVAGAPVSTAGAPTTGTAGSGTAGSGVGGSATAGSGGTTGGGTAGAAGSAAGSAGSAGSAGGNVGTGGVGPIPDTKSVMYLPNWAGSFSSWATKVDFKKMTHLLLAFGTAKGNDWNLAPDADVQAITKAAHAAGVKVLVSIGGADDDIGICNQYHTASNIDPMVMNLDAMVTRQGLDGVDVDIERGNEMKTSGNFPQFLSKLETTMHGHGKLVTTATAQYIVQDSGTDAGVISYLKSYDFVNLMIYAFDADMHQYTSELSWWNTKIGMPKNKLTWGIEFDPKMNTDLAAKLTTASKANGGIMIWEYSQGTEKTLWPAVQGAL